ncbi:hypothetical protein [Trinickia acidisoli]|uniref:hypothetical protein n=1 Tax=Trinickia acidisoli TaxID=2767482 RepID=UPI001A904CD8|nr:hypothetical protein [Trinickia acidisoli]
MSANISGSVPAARPDADAADSEAIAPSSVPAQPSQPSQTAPGYAPGLSGLERVRLARKPETTRRLHRLRHELGKISPLPSNPTQARIEIVDAMARANLSAWTVPELSGPSAVRHADGSIYVTLISHAIIFNPSGAFRIIDLHHDGRVYFEMAGEGNLTFRQLGRDAGEPGASACN